MVNINCFPVQPKNGACNFVLYDILFEELQNNTLYRML
jgi:hypothetical protein